MKQLVIVILSLVCLNSCIAQLFNSMHINVGKGIATKEFKETFNGVEAPLSISIDRKWRSFLYIGTIVTHRKVGLVNASNPKEIVGTDLTFGVRGNIYFRRNKMLKMYIGGMQGYQFLLLKKHKFNLEDFSKLSVSRLNLKYLSSIHFGIRHYPKTWFGYFVELSSGQIMATLGFSLKL